MSNVSLEGKAVIAEFCERSETEGFERNIGGRGINDWEIGSIEVLQLAALTKVSLPVFFACKSGCEAPMYNCIDIEYLFLALSHQRVVSGSCG